MSKIIPTQFTSFELSEQEELAGTVLTYEQKMVLMNQLANISIEKLALQPDPNNYPAFIQQEAYKAGQIAILQYILDSSTASEAVIAEAAKQ